MKSTSTGFNATDESSSYINDNNSGRVQLADDVPPVDLNILVVENQGLEVVHCHGHLQLDTNTQNDINDVETITTTTTTRTTVNDETNRIVRATRDLTDLPLYSPILRERPAIVCKQQDYMDYMEQFLNAPVEVQLGILDMFYQPLDSPIGKSLIEPSNILYMLCVLEDVHVIHQLLCIYSTNGHQYRGTDQAAMAIFGSKFSHSCHPNAAYSSLYSSNIMSTTKNEKLNTVEDDNNDDDCLTYVKIQPTIYEGDEVTFSYLSDLYETPTMERRDLLWQTKSFLCMCDRCVSPDFCRSMSCPQCGQIIPCTYYRRQNYDSTESTENITKNIDWLPSHDFEPSWKCSFCVDEIGTVDDTNASILRREKDVAMAIRSVEHELKARSLRKKAARSDSSERSNGGNRRTISSEDDDIATTQLQELVDDACETLSPVHHLTIKALRLLAVVSTMSTQNLITQCVLPQRQNIIKVSWFLRTSVLAGIQIVLAGECVASNCTGCYRRSCSNPNDNDNSTPQQLDLFHICHEPVYDRATPMRHVVEDLVQMPISFWPPQALVMFERYRSILEVKFGSLLSDTLQKISQCYWADDNIQPQSTLDARSTNLLVCQECDTIQNWSGRL